MRRHCRSPGGTRVTGHGFGLSQFDENLHPNVGGKRAGEHTLQVVDGDLRRAFPRCAQRGGAQDLIRSHSLDLSSEENVRGKPLGGGTRRVKNTNGLFVRLQSIHGCDVLVGRGPNDRMHERERLTRSQDSE